MLQFAPNVRAFILYDNAVDALAEAQRHGNKAVLVAVQTTNPLLSIPQDGIPPKVFTGAGTEIDPRQIDTLHAAARNYATLIMSDQNRATWEDANQGMNNPASHWYTNPMYIVHNPTLSPYTYTYYLVIPESRITSPVVYSHQFPAGSAPP
jgi:hypothetical protein